MSFHFFTAKTFACQLPKAVLAHRTEPRRSRSDAPPRTVAHVYVHQAAQRRRGRSTAEAAEGPPARTTQHLRRPYLQRGVVDHSEAAAGRCSPQHRHNAPPAPSLSLLASDPVGPGGSRKVTVPLQRRSPPSREPPLPWPLAL